MDYGTPITNVHAYSWDGFKFGTTFVAPFDGLYYFAVTFVNDADTNPNCGTPNDVFVFITQNSVDKGYAWAGETASGDRQSGAYNVVLELAAEDWVQTEAYSDGVPPECRFMFKHDLSGFLIAH